MRRLLLVPSIAFVSVACFGPVDDDAEGTAQSEVNTSFCSARSREKMLASVTGGRRKAIERGFKWLDERVSYNVGGSHDGYRTDCSGFVSMCWALGSSPSTATLFPGSKHASRLDAYENLVPGDALVRRANGKGHVMLFLGWSDAAAKKGACIMEEASTKNDMQMRLLPNSVLTKEGYKPIRATTLLAEPATTPTAAADPPPCVPRPASELCKEAATKQGLQCGSTSNGCGGTVDCDTVATLGCKPSDTCTANRCIAPKCVPQPAAALCATAKEESGVECGSIADGCGGTVSCDAVPTFGCADGVKCSPTNTCQKNLDLPKSVDLPVDGETTVQSLGDETEGDDLGSESEDSAPSRTTIQSSGCSTSSRGGGGAVPLIALAVAASLIRRRRRG